MKKRYATVAALLASLSAVASTAPAAASSKHKTPPGCLRLINDHIALAEIFRDLGTSVDTFNNSIGTSASTNDVNAFLSGLLSAKQTFDDSERQIIARLNALKPKSSADVTACRKGR